MKNIILIIVGILLFALLLGFANEKFDNAQGEFITEPSKPSDRIPDDESSEESKNETNEESCEDSAEDSSEEASEEATESTTSQPTIAEQSLDFTVVDINGNDVKRSDLIGKPIIVLFWASWSTYSRQELAAMQEVYDQYKDTYEFMAICITDGEYETLETAMSYLEGVEYDFPIYFDVYSEALHNYRLYQFESASRTYFFKADSKYTARISAGSLLTPNLLKKAISMVFE